LVLISILDIRFVRVTIIDNAHIIEEIHINFFSLKKIKNSRFNQILAEFICKSNFLILNIKKSLEIYAA